MSLKITDEVFAEEMSISKFTAGTLNAELVNLINLNASNIVTGDLDANFITGQNITLIKDSWNGIGTYANMDADRLRFSHIDGTFTEISGDGLRRLTASDNRNYHYLFYSATFIFGESSSNARWIQLPDDFKGKDFKIYMAIADSMTAPSYSYSIQRFVCTRHPNHQIDYVNARIPVIAYKANTLMNGSSPLLSDVQGLLFAIY